MIEYKAYDRCHVLSHGFKLFLMGIWVVVVLCSVCGGVSSAADVFQSPWSQTPDVCQPAPRGRVPWILHMREPNYGWSENTHRATIALAVNRWTGPTEDMAKMELQLEEEILNSLLGSSIHENDLALFIHALIATKKNPRNFHGIDLVADLLDRVESNDDVHPFLVLAICNSHAVEFRHLEKIKKHTVHRDINSTLQTREAELKALALKAFACAASLPNARAKALDKFQHAIEEAVKCLISKQTNGIFGNAYTTSLAVQALTAYDGNQKWDERKSLDFLTRESVIEVNMIKAYYIEMALNSRNVRFVKDLYDGSYDPETRVPTSEYNIGYTIKDEQNPEYSFSLEMMIPHGWNFFQVMKKASDLSDRFSFSHVMNKDEEPLIFQVTGKPNDAEENMFWRICRLQQDSVLPFSKSPAKLQPVEGERIMLWYRSSDCTQ